MGLCGFQILPLLISVIIFFSLINDVYAVEPVIESYTLQNLDNSNPVYSNGDTLTITFNIDTDRGGFPLNVLIGQANVDSLFSPCDLFGSGYDGLWISDRVFVLTVTDISGHGVVVGMHMIEPGPSPIRDLLNPADIWIQNSQSLELEVNGEGDGCDSSCNAPTLGLDKSGKRLVEHGFSYNGHSVDVESFFTPYPLIKTTTGIYNKAILKIFDDSGPENISHVELAFGLSKGHTINQRTASIFWDKHFDGTEVANVHTPTNVIGKVSIQSSEVSCTSEGSHRCLQLEITHQFRAPLDFDIVGTNVWDTNRNAWQNYFNHGIHIQGKSQNPQPVHLGIYHGKLIPIIEVEKNVSIDEDGNKWFFDKTWTMEKNLGKKIDDGVTSHLFDRNNSLFKTYMKGQELIAQHTLNSIIGNNIQDSGEQKIKTHYSEFLKRNEDVDLQKRIAYAKHSATLTFNQLFEVKHNH